MNATADRRCCIYRIKLLSGQSSAETRIIFRPSYQQLDCLCLWSCAFMKLRPFGAIQICLLLLLYYAMRRHCLGKDRRDDNERRTTNFLKFIKLEFSIYGFNKRHGRPPSLQQPRREIKLYTTVKQYAPTKRLYRSKGHAQEQLMKVPTTHKWATRYSILGTR